MKRFCGIDIGSSTIKIVLLNENGEVAAQSITPSGSHFYRNASDALDRLLASQNLSREDICRTVTTGYGRKLYKEADGNISEITANANGSSRLPTGNGKVKSIINIGGQDSKVILLDDSGGVKEFAMNDKCAAGTGRFLEMTAQSLGISLDELGDSHDQNDVMPVSINSTCTVFAASEIISLLGDGCDMAGIIAGVHNAIARRIAVLAEGVGIKETIVFDGGGALNKGLRSALETELMRPVMVPDSPQITTAMGAAIFARRGTARGF